MAAGETQSIAREVGLIIDLCADPNLDAAQQADIEDQLGLRFDCTYEGGLSWPAGAAERFGYGQVLRGQGAQHAVLGPALAGDQGQGFRTLRLRPLAEDLFR